MQEITNKKRQRSENWNEDDKIILQELIKEKVKVIENKNTDTNTNAKKVAAWKELQNSYNSMCNGSQRTIPQLKAQWGLLKMKEKKKICSEKKEIFRTGGGPAPKVEAVSSGSISSWLPDEFATDCNEFDSDHLNQLINDSNNKENNRQEKIFIDAPSEIDVIIHPPPKNMKENILDVVPSPIIPSSPPENTQEKFTAEQTPGSSSVGAGSPGSSPVRAPTTSNAKKLKPNKKKICIKKPQTATEKIAVCEIACRKELHAIQLECVNQRKKNLILKEILLKEKIKYYQFINKS